MKGIRCKQIVGASVNVMAIALIVACAHAAPSSPPGPNVTVVNTVTNPVPVVVGNFPSGTNTVVVSSSTNAPLLVRDVDKRSRTPFEESVRIELPSGLTGRAAPILTAPTGQRAVIETITVLVSVPPGQTPTCTMNLHRLSVVRQGPFEDSDLWAGTHSVRLYSDADHPRVPGIARFPATGEASALFTVSGYFEDIP